MRGTETSAATVEWVMTELLRNPNIMSKAKVEVRTVAGENKQVDESNISKLPYLQAVIKETLRYHPPAPLIPRCKDGDDLEIGTYVIPKNAMVLINTWAIGRDSRIWANLDSFEPERFLSKDFELIPFGAGRRISCPGLALAYRMVHLVVASLIQNFDWKLEDGITPKEVDLNEKLGITARKAIIVFGSAICSVLFCVLEIEKEKQR
ncbi:UNVERIFIED_CONTAM: cytochrome [Sesamum latifolium]|uniref:Cytochrome n=1 Tax=Sesamum latifolium TaxID=2727402 RepID=A0AAW2WAT0_9LAMI